MKENTVYHVIDRLEWKQYRDNNNSGTSFHLTEDKLTELTSLNDVLTLQDAKEVYEPLTELVGLHMENYNRLSHHRNRYLGIHGKIPPFIIGIAGSVAVGKSTAARLLQLFLAQAYPEMSVELITTDGFLYPNETLRANHMMNQKGFPESYNMKRLITFLTDVKNNKTDIEYPTYSHRIYDIVEDEMQVLHNPEILIVEGINVLQIPSTEQVFVSEFFDLSIYVDAETDLIEQWFYQRFNLLLENAVDKPEDYYYQFTKLPYEEAQKKANRTWNQINLVNLNDYILPTRNRADIVIHKRENHYVDELWMKKY